LDCAPGDLRDSRKGADKPSGKSCGQDWRLAAASALPRRAGTAIATFDANGQYVGHAAIYVKQDAVGIHVYDQWITGAGKAVGARMIRWNGSGVSNRGDGFYVVE